MIECVPVSGRSDEILYWIGKSDFFRWFDQKDFLCRDCQEVQSVFLTEWFRFRESETIPRFMAPAVFFHDGRTEFFGGRHRTEVLFKYLDEIPLALKPIAEEPKWPFRDERKEESLRLFSSIPKRRYREGERFFIPDLPIWKRTPKAGDDASTPILLSKWIADPILRKEMEGEVMTDCACSMTVEGSPGSSPFRVRVCISYKD